MRVLWLCLLVGCSSLPRAEQAPTIEQTAVAIRISVAEDGRVAPAAVRIVCPFAVPIVEDAPIQEASFVEAGTTVYGMCSIDVLCAAPAIPSLECGDDGWCLAYCVPP